jgi:hypothetical protein
MKDAMPLPGRHRRRPRASLASSGCFLPALLLLAGCAGPAAVETAGASSSATIAPTAGSTASPAHERYRPTPEERAYSCRKLTGLLQVKLLQLGGAETRPRPSEAALATRGAVGPLLGTADQVLDPVSGWARERARAEAYNALLAEKGCKTFDIPAELARAAERDALPPSPRGAPGR